MIFPQIGEITINDLRFWENAVILTKHFLSTQKFPRKASVRLHLFSCLGGGGLAENIETQISLGLG